MTRVTTSMLKKMQKVGIILLGVSIVTFGILIYANSIKKDVPIIFSKKELLTNLWEAYKLEYLEPGTGRTLDKQQNNITTSEGQSYTMLRAVWMGDRETFDTSFAWAQDNLKQDSTNLHSWLFGQQQNGKYGVLSERGGNNSATDAETDIALALIFAYAKWDDETYLNTAKEILKDVWAHEVVTVKGKPVLAANDVERFSSEKIIINPSYFSPYAYKIFAQIDPDRNWLGLVDSSYEILAQSSSLMLDKQTSAGLPPDWVEMNRRTGELRAPASSNLTTNYSYDAMRVPWRIALDYIWFEETRAKNYLESLSFFSTEWQTNRKISTGYMHDGSVLHVHESPAMYGNIIGYFLVADQDTARQVYEEKLQILYSPDTNTWKKTLSYYDDNWAWFGIALYENMLPNLSELLENKE